MATIKSQMVLNDGMSAVLKKITSALDVTLASFEQIQRASGNAMDVAEIEAARGALADASNAVDEMAEQYRRAAQEEERLNENIHEGTSALDGMVSKAVSLAGAYMSLSAAKGFSTDALEAADTQINAQVQLRTVLNNMGAEESFAGLAHEVGGSPLEVQADTSQAVSAYDAITAKASEIQGAGIYGDEAMIAGAAEFATYFEDANAVLSMMDTLTDYAMGMSGGGALDTEAMVDYATGLGKIMSGSYDAMTKKGFEFSDTQKAIIEGTATEAQIAAELGEEYLGMSQDMQAAAAINAVIAEGWGGLYEAMSSTPQGRLIQLNNTLGDIKENVGAGIYPAVVRFLDVMQAHLPQIEGGAMGLAAVLGYVITVLSAIAGAALTAGSVIMDNWSWIAPLVMGAALALGVYLTLTKGVAIAQGISAAAAGAYHAAVNVLSIGFGVLTGNTAAASAAVFTFNSALMASPITWVVLAVIALIAVIFAAVGAVNHFAGTSVSATGVIMGVFAALGAFVLNSTLIPLYNGFARFVNFLGNVFRDPVAAVKVLFYDMALAVIGYVSNMAHAIEDVINKIPGVTVSITSGLDSFYAGLEEAQRAVKDESGWVEYVSKMDYIDYADAAGAGYAFGQGVEDKIGGLFRYDLGSLDDIMAQTPNIPGMDGLGESVGEIADNTNGMAHALEVSGEELKYLRDIAERDAVNRFTTAEVKIDMTGMTNKIDGGADLDGVIRELTDGFSQALVTAAEGVYE